MGDKADRTGRWPMLDGLRGVAILLVLAAHVGMPGQGGPVGVTVFFVLSGFLITNLLLVEHERSGSIQLGRFYFRRAYRLLPALLIYLIGAGLIAIAFGRSGSWVWNETWPALFYVGNYAHLLVTHLDMNWHTWSLAVEEHFYLIWPLLLLLIPTRRRLRLIGVGVAGLVAWSAIAWHFFPQWGYSSTDANAYALAAGCLVAAARRQRVRVQFPVWSPLLGVVLIVTTTSIPVTEVRQPFLVAIAAITVWACADAKVGVLGVAPLRFMGKISYGAYLWHVPLLMVAGSALDWRLGAALVSVGVAWLSWVAVEHPILARRDGHWKRLAARRTPIEGTPMPRGLVMERAS